MLSTNINRLTSADCTGFTTIVDDGSRRFILAVSLWAAAIAVNDIPFLRLELELLSGVASRGVDRREVDNVLFAGGDDDELLIRL
ncbi:MAG: hypothetical protein GY869_18940 [Planctomycetes bacterium]|nr:hypothetical protein [Planctomycetota bacterium]